MTTSILTSSPCFLSGEKNLVQMDIFHYMGIPKKSDRQKQKDKIESSHKKVEIAPNIESELNFLKSLSEVKKEKLEKINVEVENVHENRFEDFCHYQPVNREKDFELRKANNNRIFEEDCPLPVIYNSYSGNGKLHNVEFSQCASFYDYTKAKQEFEAGQFFTPDHLCRDIVKVLEVEKKARVADIACGMGRFFNWLPERECYGRDISIGADLVAAKCFPNAKVRTCGMQSLGSESFDSLPNEFMDYCVGNPPFNIQFENFHDHELATQTNAEESGKGIVLSQNMYLFITEQILKYGGTNALIVPATWLNEELRDKKVRAYLEKKFWKLAEIYLPLDTFQEYQIKFATKILILMKRHDRISQPPESIKIEPNQKFIEKFHQSEVGRWYYSAKKVLSKLGSQEKFKPAFVKAKKRDKNRKIEDRYKKLLFALKKIDPVLAEKAESLRKKVSEAVKPDFMKCSEWEEKKPTMLKLEAKMKKYLKPQKKANLIRLIKTSAKIKLKAFSHEASRCLNKLEVQTEWSLHQLINKNFWQTEWKSFQSALAKLRSKQLSYRTKEKATFIEFQNFSVHSYFRKKHREFSRLRQDIALVSNPKIKSHLEKLILGDKKLLPHQREDIEKASVKPIALLNWEMGTGKTLAAIAWAEIKTKLTLVVAPSLLIRKTWGEELNSLNKPYAIIEKFSDIETTQDKAFVLISLERLPRFYKRLRKVRFRNLIVDESDSVKNKASARAKALKAIARKIKNKLILTGTFTRNNALEAYSQLELLFNNSTAFLSEVPNILEFDRSTKEYATVPNPINQLPFPAYGGQAMFRKCFSPKKTTVFGAAKTNQELFNKYALEKLLKSVRLRRRFEEIKPAGVSYDVRQVSIPMTPSEIKVYNYIFDKFVRLVEDLYCKSHDRKTARMLVIMRQIIALLQGVSHPWTFPEYDGGEITSKMKKVIEIVKNNPDKKIMFGSPWKPTAATYAKILNREFKITYLASDLPIAQRNKLIQKFRNGDSQVLTSTIGVLKAGVNLPEVEIVITDSYPWNYAQLSQYFFRAIRLNSTNHTQVYCLSNEGSFDTNVFSLMIAKERVNKFIQDGDEVDNVDLAKDFGVSEDLLQSAIQMTKERSQGRTRSNITWGKSTVSNEMARAEN